MLACRRERFPLKKKTAHTQPTTWACEARLAFGVPGVCLACSAPTDSTIMYHSVPNNARLYQIVLSYTRLYQFKEIARDWCPERRSLYQHVPVRIPMGTKFGDHRDKSHGSTSRWARLRFTHDAQCRPRATEFKFNPLVTLRFDLVDQKSLDVIVDCGSKLNAV